MTPFAVAGIQMHLQHGSNIEAMRHRLDLTMQLYPWVQMVTFWELACFGPLLHHAQPLPGAPTRITIRGWFSRIPSVRTAGWGA